MTASTHSSAASTGTSPVPRQRPARPLQRRTEASEFRQTIRQTASVSGPRPAGAWAAAARRTSACPANTSATAKPQPKPRLSRPAPSGMNGHPVRRRPGPFSFLLLRDRCGVADRGDDRPDPARLAQAPWPWTATWPEPPDAALPCAAHRRPPRPRRAETASENPGHLAMGRSDHGRPDEARRANPGE